MSKPLWIPKNPNQTLMAEFMHSVGQKDYFALHGWSIEHKADFWMRMCEFFDFEFDKPPEKILNNYQTMLEARWFEGAYFNFAEKLLKRKDAHIALICREEQGHREVFTYEQLYEKVAECCAGLQNLGVKKGDRIAAVLPNVAETIIAMLAASALGAIWSSCSPDFGVQALLDRLEQIQPKVLFFCDGYHYQGHLYETKEKILKVYQALPDLQQLVICPLAKENILDFPQKNVVLWKDFLIPAKTIPFVSLPFNHPLYILFSSGTTGKPKCIMHGAGGTLLQHIKELGLHTNLQVQDNLFFYTTCGWMMWNWMVSALALGTTLTLYNGSPQYPDFHRLFQIIQQEKVTVFGTSAKFISAVEKAKVSPLDYLKNSSLRTILTTGSPLLPQHFDFVYAQINQDVQLSSISGGTDIVSCFALGNPVLPVYKGELQCLGLGMSVKVFDQQGKPVSQTKGELVCTQPFPSMPIGFWQDREQILYKKAYFERFAGVWTQGDFAELTIHHGLIIYGRSDAVLNPGGVRIGTAEIYRQLEDMTEILDSVVISQDWKDDVRIVLFVQLRPGYILDENLQNLIRKRLKEKASPRHVPAKILQVGDIPRTISGKIVELAVRQVVHNQTVNNLGSLANPEALAYFKDRKELKD